MYMCMYIFGVVIYIMYTYIYDIYIYIYHFGGWHIIYINVHTYIYIHTYICMGVGHIIYT